jgi:competence protein ComEA
MQLPMASFKARRWGGFAAVVASGVILAALAAPASAAPQAAAKPGLPDGPGKTQVQSTCQACHGIDVILAKHATKDGWTQTIMRMQGMGAEVSDSDLDVIASYLAAHFGPVINVNKATEQQFMDSFGMTASEAAAMVKYRTANGDFKSVDDMLKVPDVDAKKIQAQSGNIVFQDPASAAH